MLRILLLTAAAAAALPSQPQDPDDTFDAGVSVLRVDGEEITADEYTRWLIETSVSRFGNDFAQRWAVLREAERRAVVVPDEDVAELVDFQIQRRITHAFRGEKQGWLNELERAGRTEGGYRRQQFADRRPQFVCKAMVTADRAVPEDKVVRDWELKHGPRGVDVELLMMKFHVQASTPPGSSPDELERSRERALAEKKAIALEVRERLLAGADFGTLAARFSDEQATREGRGRPGKPFRRSGWSPQFVDAVMALEPGELSEPMHDGGGLWLVQCVRSTKTPLEDVRAEIEAELIARGPERDEVERLWEAVSEDVEHELRPEIFGPGAPAGGGETIGMIVDGQAVPRAAVATWLLHIRGEWQAPHFVAHWLVQRKAARMEIVVTKEQVERRADELLQWLLNSNPEFSGSLEAWQADLSMNGRTVAGFMRELRFRMHIDLLTQELLLAERVVTEEAARAEYERQFGEDGRWIEARMIRLGVPPPDLQQGASREQFEAAVTENVDATRLRAAGLVDRLRSGEDFATLARRHSDDPISRETGGRLEGRFRPDAWSDEIARAVLGLDLGEVSGPLFDYRSYCIFEIASSRPAPFEEVRADIRSELKNREPENEDLAAYQNALMGEIEYELLPGMWE